MPLYFVPPARLTSIPRAHRVISDAPLTVVRGGAGTGKSILLAQQARLLDERGSTVVWVGLNQEDSGQARLLARIADRLAGAGLIDRNGLAVALTGEPAAVARLLERRLEEQSTPLVLVVDDYHHVADRAADEMLLELLERGVFHLMIATRHSDGLQSARAAARIETHLVETEALALTVDETTELLQNNGVADAATVARVIHRATRGWPLATFALVVEARRGTLDLTGSARGRLARDILQSTIAQDPRLHTAALRLSVADELSGALAAELTGTTITEAHADLARLESAGLGSWQTTPSGEETFVFHPLIRHELGIQARATLRPEVVRAGMIATADQLHADRIGRAFELYIEAGAWESAERALRRNYGPLTALHRPLVVAALERVPGETLEAHPVLAGTRTLLDFGDRGSVGSRLTQGLKVMTTLWRERSPDRDGLDSLVSAAFAMGAYRLSGDGKRARELADRAVERMERLPANELADESTLIPTILTQIAITYLYLEEFDTASHHLGVVLSQVEKGGTAGQRLHALSILALAQAVRGDMSAASATVDTAASIDGPAEWENSYFGAGYRIARSHLALERGDAEAAMVELDALSAHPTIEHWPYIAQLRARATTMSRGAEAGLLSLTTQWERMRRRPSPLPHQRAALAALQAELLVLSGQVARAEHAVVREESIVRRPSLGRARIAVARADLTRAAAVASEVAWQSHTTPRRHTEALVLLATAQWLSGDHNEAVSTLTRAHAVMVDNALTTPLMAAPGAVIDHIAAAGSLDLPRRARLVDQPVVTAAIQPLSRSERDVLTAFVSIDGATVRDVALHLHLAEGTVRSHLKRAYKKLGVNTRDDAVRRAAMLGMVSRSGGPVGP